MKRIVVLLCAGLALTGFAEWIVDGVDVDKPVGRIDRNLPQDQKDALIKAKTIRHKLKTGGTVRDVKNQKGRVAIINAQKQVDGPSIAKRAETMGDFLRVKIEAKDFEGKITLGDADKVYAAEKAEACVFIVDDSSLPVPILNAPERKWAFLNVAALAADKPDKVTLKMRTLKEMWRAVGYMMSLNTPSPVCVLKGAYSLAEIDKLVEMPASTSLPPIWANMAKMGINQCRVYPYFRALEEGWAPMPTNIYQRAAYERWQKYKGPDGKVPLGAPIVRVDD